MQLHGNHMSRGLAGSIYDPQSNRNFGFTTETEKHVNNNTCVVDGDRRESGGDRMDLALREAMFVGGGVISKTKEEEDKEEIEPFSLCSIWEDIIGNSLENIGDCTSHLPMTCYTLDL